MSVIEVRFKLGTKAPCATVSGTTGRQRRWPDASVAAQKGSRCNTSNKK